MANDDSPVDRFDQIVALYQASETPAAVDGFLAALAALSVHPRSIHIEEEAR